jgi:hypothetical protein
VKGRPVTKVRGITPWMGEEQELLFSLYKENKINHEIAKIINKTYWNGQEVRTADSVRQYILFAIEKRWLKKTRVDETFWKKEELARTVELCTAPEDFSKREVAEKLNQEFHDGRPVRTVRSIEYGLNLAFEKGYDPLIGVEEHGPQNL